ncbi:MAG: hypothetical protein V2J62_02100 [candidate division KSB1 bacterium]|jgi:hypothetical protein|nr:hypothetical protein [candidate division KSB1 bacterium]
MPSYISPVEGEGGGRGGGGPEEDRRFAVNAVQSRGLITVAFGLALGFSLLIFSFLLKWGGITVAQNILEDVGCRCFPCCIFGIGFVFGILIAAIYNLLLFKHLNLFGTDLNMD